MNVHNTTYETVRTTTVTATRAPKRLIPFGEPLRVSPKKVETPAAAPKLADRREKPDHQLAAVAIPVNYTEYLEYQEDSGLVLVVARVTPRMADVFKLAFEAFPSKG